MKVLHGLVEVAGQGIYSVKGLRENGVDAHMAVWSENPSGYEVDYSLGIKGSMRKPLNIVKILSYAIKAAFRYDCFHFHFAKSLIPGNFDLPLLKLLKKKVFFEFHGSELRGMIRDIPYTYFKTRERDEKQKKRLEKIAKYADGFILHDEELRPHLPESNVPVHIVPLRVDIEQFIPEFSDVMEKNPKVVHAPSHRGNKGTEVILQKIDDITDSYELKLVENKTQQEAFRIYQKADVIVDQIGMGTYGVLAIEGMALGKPVMGYISQEMRASFPSSLPVISIEPDNLQERLETLLRDGRLRKAIGIQGRKYVEEYHDYKRNGMILKEIYEGK